MELGAAVVLVVGAILVWPSRGTLELGQNASAPTYWSPPAVTVDRHSGEAGSEEHPATVTVEAAADALVLCALALRSGLGPVEALDAVAARVPPAVGHQLRIVASAHRWGQDSATAWGHLGDGWRASSLAWQAAERSGAAPAGVVLAAAQRMRREETSRIEAAVQRAGVLLVLPLGLCFLPGFIGTTIAPVVLHLAGASLGGVG